MSSNGGDPVAELNAALAAAQGEFPPITKTRTVKPGSYSYNYAPLDVVLAAVRPALTKHGLAITQRLESVHESGDVWLRTELRHRSGGVLGSSFPFRNVPDNPQQFGSLLTYFRRYAIQALLGVATEEDDDGQKAADHKPRSKPKREAAPPPAALMLTSWLTRRGLTDREAQVNYCSAILGREITGSADMTDQEMETVIEQLQDINTVTWPSDTGDDG